MKRAIFTFLFLFFFLNSFSVDNIFDGSTDSNWGTAANWSLNVVPVSTDGYVTRFDATSPNCTVNTANRTCNSISFSGYTNTITMSFQITSYGSVTLSSLMGISGSGNLAILGNATLTSNGKTWPNTMSFTSTNTTKTLADDWIVSGLLTCTNSAQTINGFSMRLNSGYSSTAIVNGTTVLIIGGGTWSQTQALSCPVTLDGNVVISGAIAYSIGPLTYQSGIITTTGSTLSIAGIATTFNTGAVVWNNVTYTSTGTVQTFLSDFYISGTWSLQNTNATTQTLNGFTIYCSGNITHGSTSAIVTGTSEIVYSGTGTWSAATSGQLRNNFTINTSGTLTIADVNYNTGTMKWISGTVNCTGTVTVGTNTIFETAGFVFNNVTLTGNSTITINSLMTGIGTLSIPTVSVVFDGTDGGWSFASFNITTGNQTLKGGATYTISTNFTCTGTASNSGSLAASGSPTKAIFTLLQGATQDVGFCDAIRMDSSAGQTIWTYKGTITTSFNWNTLPVQPQTITTAN